MTNHLERADIDGLIDRNPGATCAELAEALRELVARKEPEQDVQVVERLEEYVRAEFEARAIRPGHPLPDFQLPDTYRRTIRFSSVLKNGPAVLVFFKGGWCPFCAVQLRLLERNRAQIEKAGATVVGISPQTPEFNKELVEAHDLHFLTLSDLGNQVAGLFGLTHHVPEWARELMLETGLDLEASHDDSLWLLPIPATLVVAPDCTVIAAWSQVDEGHGAELDDVLEALAASRTG